MTALGASVRVRPEMPDGFFTMPPETAVAVVSPGDSRRAVQRKARRSLDFGTGMVGIVHPKERAMDGCLPTGGDGMLVLGAVLPGFSLPLCRSFPPPASPAADEQAG